MTNKDVDWVVQQRIEMITSLLDSLTEAGSRRFTWEELRNMSCEELVRRFAVNGLRFHVEKQDKNCHCKQSENPQMV